MVVQELLLAQAIPVEAAVVVGAETAGAAAQEAMVALKELVPGVAAVTPRLLLQVEQVALDIH